MLILLATLVQFILGGFWYSPLMFGKWWMEIMEATHLSKEELQKLQKEMLPFYGLQLLLTLLTTFYFARFANYFTPSFGIYSVAFWVWIGFIAPVQVACVIWANTKKRFWFKQIFIMVSYQLVAIMITAFILSM